uniref:Recep_L_domain domain-containing protein n=1 Tax=Panagrellus redivivus TaxID=6233 RepID=A0A7E4V8X4_PANRE
MTMPFIEYENDNLPISNLPYGFTRRLINLTSTAEGDKIDVACPNIVPIRDRRHISFNQVYITDSQLVYDIAVKEEAESIEIDYLTRLSDGPLTINPSWESVLLVYNIVAKNEYLGINDTLILYFTSTESYDRLIPLISGTYSRLILYGNFTWAQVHHLLHSKVKQVRIMGKVKVNPEDYDNVIKLVLRFASDLDHKLSFRIKDCFPPELMERINEICANHETHSLVQILVYVGLIAVFGYNIDASYGNDRSVPHFMIKVLFCGFTLCILLVFFPGFANLTNYWPKDVKIYVKVNYPWMVENDDGNDNDSDDDHDDDD